jgi:uncharacterized protein
MIEIAKINDIVSRIATQFDPDMIIMFGSYAAGTPNNDSDLDLLVITETDLPLQRRSFDIQKSLIGTRLSIDILVYTRKEFEQGKNVKHSFLNNAIKTSELLYERA